MVRDKRSADTLASFVTSSILNVETKVIDKKPLAVVREIPHNYSRADLEASVEVLIKSAVLALFASSLSTKPL